MSGRDNRNRAARYKYPSPLTPRPPTCSTTHPTTTRHPVGLGQHQLEHDCGAAQFFTDAACTTAYVTADQTLYGTTAVGNTGHCAKTGNVFGSCLDGPSASVSICREKGFALYRPDGESSLDSGNFFEVDGTHDITLGYPQLKGRF